MDARRLRGPLPASSSTLRRTGHGETSPIVSPQEFGCRRPELLVEEKKLTRARGALAATPPDAVDSSGQGVPLRRSGGPGEPSRPVQGRRQLIVYRAFYAPDVTTYPQGGGAYPERACVGCSFLADQVAHPAHLNARDTTLAFVSRAPQAEIHGLKERMGWQLIPWYTITDDFDKDFGVDEWHGTNAFVRDGERIYRTYFVNSRGAEAMGSTWIPGYHGVQPPGGVGGLAGGLSADPAVRVVELPRRVRQDPVIVVRRLLRDADRPGPRQPQPVPGPGQLSTRERELVTLVAQGRTDTQIAAQLSISVRAVGSHLDQIRDKDRLPPPRRPDPAGPDRGLV